MSVKAVVFDLGGVLTECQKSGKVRRVIDDNGLDFDEIVRHREHLARVDRDEITINEYYRICYPKASDELIRELVEADTVTYLTRRESSIDRLKGYVKDGMKTAIVSACSVSALEPMREIFADCFSSVDAVLVSGETGIWKPSVELVREVEKVLGVAVEDTLWIDDDSHCLDVAKRMGANVELFDPCVSGGTLMQG